MHATAVLKIRFTISLTDITSELPNISELHQIHYARYPQAKVIPVTLIAHFDDLVDQRFADIAKPTVLR